MKVYAYQLLALCGAAAAFTVPSSQTLKPSSALYSTPAESSPVPAASSSSGIDWDISSVGAPVRIEGQTRKTFQFNDVNQEVVQLVSMTDGRPLHEDIQLWIGPDWTPLSIKTYSEDGLLRPVQTLLGTRNKMSNIEVKNTGQYEFPVSAAAKYATGAATTIRDTIPETSEGHYVEGGAIYSVPFEPGVEKIQVLMKTDTRQLNAQVEILNGPNNIKQAYKVFTNNGVLNALYVVFNAPGDGNTIRIMNKGPLEFPFKAYVSGA